MTLGILGPAVFVVTFLIDGATRPGYVPTRHAVSALATGERGWLQTVNFLLCGTLIVAAAPGIAAASGAWLLGGAVAVFGSGLVASGVFPMDPMRSYPPGTPPGTPPVTSTRHQRHDGAGMVVFGALPVAAIIAAFSLDDLAWIASSGVVAVALVVLLVWFSNAWEHDGRWAGLVQRCMIIVGWAWLGALCWYLLG